MPSAPSRNPQALVHGHKRHEADQDAQSENEVAVRLDEHKPSPVRLVLADKDLGQQVEERVSQQASYGKGHHDGQRGRVDVGRDEGEEEVGRAGDVERGEEGVDGGRAGEQHGEELCREGGRRSFEMRPLGGVEFLDDGTCLYPQEEEVFVSIAIDVVVFLT